MEGYREDLPAFHQRPICVDPANGEWFDSNDPYRGKPWAKIPRGSAADADRAVKAANEAMWRGPWSKMTASARGKAMRKLGDLVAANAERLAEIEVRDNGKLMAEMLGQLRYHPEWWWYFGGLVDKLEGGLVPIDKADTFAYTMHEPVGVVAALTAWNCRSCSWPGNAQRRLPPVAPSSSSRRNSPPQARWNSRR